MTKLLRRVHKSFRRPSTARTMTIWTLVVALIVGIIGAGASSVNAQINPQNDAVNQPINTTIGQTLVVTTDQNGSTTPFNLVLLNGQVYGEGSENVSLDMNNYGTKTWNLNNGQGQVQNFLNVSGPYQGDIPITIQTAVKLNGQEIDPDTAYNMTGDVEITYTFTNNTSRQQTISYKGFDGETVTTKTDVPVPFGNSFSASFGEGWFITDAGKMTQKVTSEGTKLSATVLMFPLIPGMVGGTTQTYTVQANVENADLPGTISNAVPQNLDNMLNEYLPTYGPMIQDDVVKPLEGMVADSLGQVYSAANLITGYTGSFQKLNVEFIDPLIKELTSIKVRPGVWEDRLNRLSIGLQQLSTLMAENEASADDVALMLNATAGLLDTQLPQIVRWLESLINEAGPAAGQAATALTDLNDIMKNLNTTTLTEFTGPEWTAWCNSVNATSTQYGYSSTGFPFKPFFYNGVGYGALSSAVTAASGANKTALQSLQTTLNSQAAGTLPQKGIFNIAQANPTYLTSIIVSELVDQGIPQAEAAVIAPQIVTMLSQAGCKTTQGLVATYVLPLANIWSTYGSYIPIAIEALEVVAALANSPILDTFVNEIIAELHKASKIVSTPSCSNSDILQDIEAAVKKYGINGLQKNIAAILTGILSHCGIEQLVLFLGSVDALIGKGSAALSKFVRQLSKDMPKVADAAKKVEDIAAIGGNVFDSIPGLGRKVGDAIAGFATKAGVAGETVEAKISNYIAQLLATVHAMSARTQNGDGAPYGNAKGENVQNMTVYQITQQAARPYGTNWTIAIVMAAIFLLIAVGLGTFLFRRRHRPIEEFIDGGDGR